MSVPTSVAGVSLDLGLCRVPNMTGGEQLMKNHPARDVQTGVSQQMCSASIPCCGQRNTMIRIPLPLGRRGRMTDPSINIHPQAGSRSVLRTVVQTSFLAQRRNHWKTPFQSPNRSGMSRRGAPVRRIQRTAFRKSRLLPVRPGSFGSRCSIRANCSSDNTKQRITPLWDCVVSSGQKNETRRISTGSMLWNLDSWIMFLNFVLVDVSLVPEWRKPSDLLIEGLPIGKSRAGGI